MPHDLPTNQLLLQIGFSEVILASYHNSYLFTVKQYKNENIDTLEQQRDMQPSLQSTEQKLNIHQHNC